MQYLINILKSKLFYVIILLIYIVNSAMTYNESHNPEKVAAFYGESMPTKSEELVNFALEQLGKPYRYASKGPNSFDCSGFTGYVFKEFQINLPASALKQSYHGKAVNMEEILPGDLLFFSNQPGGAIDHVGIVVQSDAEGVTFIHSTTSRGVMIDDLESAHYSVRYKGGRRVL